MPFNVSRHLRDAALRQPTKPAVVLRSGRSISFAQLDAECDRFAKYFQSRGILPGMRVAVFVRPGFAFVPTIFGCFRLGAIPVCIDPGMKLRNVISCVREAAPEAIIGVKAALWLARLFPSAFRTARIRLRVPRIVPGRFEGTTPVSRVTQAEATAAVLFTSGSTGSPKGVVCTHAAFDAQMALLRDTYGITKDEIDLVVFPLFALFSAAWGITAVIPKLNPARPAGASGRHLADLIRRYSVTHTAGSPAIWKNLARHCRATGTELPSLRRILMAGAQVPEKLVRECAKLAREIHTPYGATEALPLTTISQAELWDRYPATRRGAGTCVGKPLAGVDIAILPFIDGPISHWDESLRRPANEHGEIAVRAPWVTREYFRREAATRMAKIPSAQGVWHRMGDVGYLDEAGRLWFCGRKDHRIFTAEEILYPDTLEAIFDSHPEITRSAVVGVGPRGKQKGVLVIEGRRGRRELETDLRRYADAFPAARTLSAIVFRKRFPVDVRHNIKIDRIGLARLIEGEVT